MVLAERVLFSSTDLQQRGAAQTRMGQGYV
jgi:hypothetical protein